jgi:hypothetical protein
VIGESKRVMRILKKLEDVPENGGSIEEIRLEE